MLVISDLSKNGKKYDVILSNGEILSVSFETKTEFFLYKGKEVTLKELDSIKRYEASNVHFLYALKIISSRDYATRDIKEKLEKRGVLPEYIDEIIAKLKAVDLINDERYARNKVDYLVYKKNLSERGITTFLKNKGINEHLIKDILVSYPNFEIAKLEREIPKLIKQYQKGSVLNAKQKIKTKLFSLGYKSETIAEVLDKFNMHDVIDEAQNLKVHYNQLLKRVKNRDEKSLKLMYNKLINAGFPRECIKQVMEGYDYEN